MVSRTDQTITLIDAVWVADTGRRHKFFEGQFDENCEIEAYAPGELVELPAAGAIVSGRPHEIPTSR